MYCKWTDALTTVDNKGPLPSLTDYIAACILHLNHTLTHSICQTSPTLRFLHGSLSILLPTQEFVFTTCVHVCMHTRQTCYTVILCSTICPFQTIHLDRHLVRKCSHVATRRHAYIEKKTAVQGCLVQRCAAMLPFRSLLPDRLSLPATKTH